MPEEFAPPPAGPEEELPLEAGAARAARGTPARHGSLAAFDLLAEGEEGEGAGEGREPGSSGGEASAGAAAPEASFTARSRYVLAEFRRRFVPAPGSKRKSGGLAAAALSLEEVVEGKGRAEACRCAAGPGAVAAVGSVQCVAGREGPGLVGGSSTQLLCCEPCPGSPHGSLGAAGSLLPWEPAWAGKEQAGRGCRGGAEEGAHGMPLTLDSPTRRHPGPSS